MEPLLEKAEIYVHQYLLDNLSSEYVFHNFDHAQEVVEVANETAAGEALPQEELELVLLAAWFHDTGYAGGAEGHEDRSAKVARLFLEEVNYPEPGISQVEKLIRSTREEHEPENLMEQVLHDACWSFMGRKRFFRKGRLLRLELENTTGKEYSLQEWNEELLQLQLSVKFYTRTALDRFSTRRNKNIAEQRENLSKATKQTTRVKTGKDFGRGVDTIYRITLRNHINLSSIADGKANMIISINTLVLSILITVASAGVSITNLNVAEDINLREDLSFIAPLVILMLSSLTAIIFAVLSAMPKVDTPDFTMDEVRQHKVSLLFFGNFLKLPKEDFVAHLRELKKDQEILYDDLSRDLYNLGAVLRKKYRLLTAAYRAFVGGLILSVLAFLISYFLF